MSGVANRVSTGSISSGDGWLGVAEDLCRVTVEILSRDGRRGAGVIWTSDGLVVTNAHVANGPAVIRFHDGFSVPAELVGRYPQGDLAALRADLQGLPVIKRRDSRTLRPGELVIAVGFPSGIDRAVSVGIVHAASEGPWIEADIRLAPGNSGGPLADAQGRVSGINAMVMSGMGIAVSTVAIQRFLSRVWPAREGAA